MNGDGFDDILIGASSADPNGNEMQERVMCLWFC
nr:FG-GAP repeat protein [Crocosphaera watsonii]